MGGETAAGTKLTEKEWEETPPGLTVCEMVVCAELVGKEWWRRNRMDGSGEFAAVCGMEKKGRAPHCVVAPMVGVVLGKLF
jgi:hypothetical protein